MKVLIMYYSLYGHVKKMADAIAEGVKQVDGAEVVLRRVAETLPDDIIESVGAKEAQQELQKVPVVTLDDMREASAIIVGTPTRYGNMCSQMQAFIDSTGPLWAKDELVGKVGGAFTSTATLHGGQESTILHVHTMLLHLGLVIVGLPYSFKGQAKVDEVTGCSPYGASTIAGGQGERTPTNNELEGARFQGRHTAEIAKKLFG
ncbi:NAD(P)H:quinone oxidoreductase [Pontibacter oryzae]|uniref:NAD(P)H dehydrogenase (quinone) n=1 Tax=Pontibacter oryzae TaxID=2304593 RepID=A0A399RXK7_9BACT|nr:NAD(P)H:quinone oxidoreductase [Pontibacter oryzae]RIJ36720.1 NAD(P)H:quinone oxidoreductase [Pontibacter oryzae]